MIQLIDNVKVYVVGGDTNYAKFIENHKIVDRLEDADIVLFTGGEDVSPELYGAKKDPTTYSNLARDKYEQSVFNSVDGERQLCVGICRGAQFLAVMNGSKLIQDVPGHAITGTHTIRRYSPFIGSLPDELEITSTHHQMLDERRITKRGRILYISTIDNRPEIFAYENINDDRPSCLCIQGHPEIMPTNSNAVLLCNSLIYRYLSYFGKYCAKYIDFGHRMSNSKWSTTSTYDRFSKVYHDTWCFGNLFKEEFPYVDQTADYKITYYIDTPTKYSNTNPTRNWCIFSKSDIQIYFEKLRKVHDFQYEITDVDDKNYLVGYRFNVTINANVFWHKLLITLIRYAYMFPYNFMLSDALQLIKNGYNHYSIINILNIINFTTKEILFSEREYDFFACSEYDDISLLNHFSKTQFYNKLETYLKDIEDDKEELDLEALEESDDDSIQNYSASLTKFSEFYGRIKNNAFGFIDNDYKYMAYNYSFWINNFDKRLTYYKDNFKAFYKK